MKKTNKQLNLSIKYTENLYKIVYLIKMNLKVYVIFLLNMLTKQRVNLFYKFEYKSRIKFF